jgi:uncharacterized protein YjbI with pentapeptide repeats
LFSLETASVKLAVEAGIKSGADLGGADLGDADLRDADLGDADLRGANLRGADLRDADLRDANLRGADLRDAYLGDADLRDADLGDADLRDAYLGDADLRDADLGDADLRGANLGDADLRGANLRDADLTSIRDDVWAVLSASPGEAVGLRAAIAEGRINGLTYEGTCACLVGTLANVRGCHYKLLPTLIANGARPAEKFFISIKTGDTPGNSQFSALALEWVDQWLASMRAAFETTR